MAEILTFWKRGWLMLNSMNEELTLAAAKTKTVECHDGHVLSVEV